MNAHYLLVDAAGKKRVEPEQPGNGHRKETLISRLETVRDAQLSTEKSGEISDSRLDALTSESIKGTKGKDRGRPLPEI